MSRRERSALTAEQALERARERLAELEQVAAEALTRARAALGGGVALGKAETRALNRAASLTRYVAECAHAVMWQPPPARKKTGVPLMLETPLVLPKGHEARAVELLRRLPLFGDAETGLERVGGHWVDEVRAWMAEDAKLVQEATK